MGSRACPYKCTYCSAPILSTNKIRTRSVGRVISEIHRIQNLKNIQRVTFLDEVFGAKLNWLKELAQVYPREVGLPFTAEIHPELCSDLRVSLYAEAGLSGVEMGVQSGSERIRHEIMNRPVSQRTIIEAINRLHNYGIAVTIDLILDNPYDTEEDMRETFNLLLALPRPLSIKTFSLCHLPGTELTNRLLNEGLITPYDVEDQAFKTHHAWRARMTQPREKWCQYWTSLILLAAVRELPDTAGGWLVTATSQSPILNKFSVKELEKIAGDPLYRLHPEKLHELFVSSIPKSQAELF